MPKIDPNTLRRKPKTTFTAVLADSLSGVSQEHEFRILTANEMLAAQDEADQLALKHIDKQVPLGIVGDEVVHASRRAINVASVVAFAQTADDGPDRYTVKELLLLMASDEITNSVMSIYNKVLGSQEEESDEGNSHQTSGAPSPDAV